MKKILPFFVLYFVWSFSFNANGQSLYKEFDDIVGINNTPISYGVLYKEKYRKLNNNTHNFLIDESFKKGRVFYRGQFFDQIDLKYEIVDDFIVIKLTNQEQQISIIPEKTLVDYFFLENQKFIYSKPYGFLEELIKKDTFSVLKKHSKISRENRDADYRYHTFKKKESYILYFKNSYVPVNKKRDFTTLFPNKRKQISSFYKSNRYFLKNDYKTFVAKLISQLQE